MPATPTLFLNRFQRKYSMVHGDEGGNPAAERQSFMIIQFLEGKKGEGGEVTDLPKFGVAR